MLDHDPVCDGLQIGRDLRIVSSFNEVVEARLEFLYDPSQGVREAFTDDPKNRALFIATDSRNCNRLRPQFGGAGVFPSRVLEAQTLHERPVHLLYGINEVGD